MVGRGRLHADGSGAQYSGNEDNCQGLSDKLQEPPGSEAGMEALEADAVREALPLSTQATHVLWSSSTSGVLRSEHDLWRPCPLRDRARC